MSDDNPWAMPGEVAELRDAIAVEALDMTASVEASLDRIIAALDKLNPDRAVETLGRLVAYMLLHIAEPNQEHLLADAFCHALHAAIRDQKDKDSN